ncbi:MAG: LPS translocon maturation chaperone LptM [Thermomonas haemolytica]
MIRRLALLLLSSCLLAACGNKGALVLPDKPAANAPPAAPAQDPPPGQG